MPENKKTFKVGNEVYDIEETQVKEFLKDVPDAIEVKSFTVDKDTFDIPLNDVNDFLKDVPDAKPLFTEIEPTGEGKRGARGAISGALGKISAEPTKSGGLGSATKEKPQRVELQSQLPTNLSADQTQQLIESNIQGAELAGLDYESIAQQAAGKSPVQLGFEQLQKIQDPKEKFETARSLYKVAANQVTDDNSILESELNQFGQGIEQMKSELDFQRQQYEEFLAAGDSESANIIGEQINEQLEVFNQASGQYNQMVGKYNDNAKFLGILNAGRVAAYGEAERAGVTGSLKLPMGTAVFSNMIGNTSLPFSPDDVFVASTWNAIAPNVIRTLGAAAGLTGYFDSPAGLNLSTPSKDAEEALLNIANAIEIDAAKFSPQGTEFAITEDVNAYSVAQLLGSLTGSIAGSIGSAGLAGTGKAAMVFNGTQGFGEMYSWGRENGLDELESTLLATPVALVYGYLGDKGVESLTNIVGKQSFKNIVKEGLKELGEQKTPQALSQLMIRSLKEFGKKTAEGTIREGIQEGVEFTTEFGTKKLAAETGLVDTKEDLTLEAFQKGLTESMVAGAIGGGLLGGLLGSSPRKTLADVVAKATKDPIAEQEFIDDMNSLLQGTQITREQYDEVMGEFEKAKAVNQTIPNNVTNDAARAEAIDLIQERDELQQQAEVTDPAMVKPLTDRIDEINNNLNQISFFNQQTTQEEKVEKDWKKKAGLKSISEIIQGQKDKKDRAERLKSGKEIFDEQKKKGEQVRLRKEQEAKAQVEAQRLQRDAEVDELNRIRPDLTNEDLILGELSDNVDRVMDRMEMNIPTDIVSVDEAIAELDRKFDEISAYRNNPKRTHTTAQIDEVVELLDAAKTELQYYKETIIDDEKSIEERKRVSGIPETKTAQATPTAEVNQETITPQENEVNQEVQAEGQQEVISEPPQVEPLITEENEANEESMPKGLSGLRGEEETGQDRAEVRPQEEEQAKDEVISKATGTKVEDIKGLKQVLKDVFGLNNMQSDSVAVVMDRMIGAMAIREGVGKDEMYQKITFGKSTLENLPKGALMQVEAFHGSPYQFDKFELSKIGTGEGAQAFGWGLYFTDLEGIARDYAEKLTGDKTDIKVGGIDLYQLDWRLLNQVRKALGVSQFSDIDTSQKTKNIIKKELKEQKEYLEDIGVSDYDGSRRWLAILTKMSEGDFKVEIEKPSKNLYKVSLHKDKTPEQYTWIEWDKPVKKDTWNRIVENLNKEYPKIQASKTTSDITDANGKDAYKDIASALVDNGYTTPIDAEKQASLFLLRAGIDGIKYPAESVARGATSDTARGFNYVVFDENAISIEEVIKFQKDAEKARGAAMVAMDGQAVIYALTDPNVSTPLHELAHVYEHYLTDQERADVLDWAGTKDWTVETSEKFARGFEKYLSEGVAPDKSLEGIFKRFQKWLTDIYNGITGSEIDLALNDKMREIYSAMLGFEVAKQPATEQVEEKGFTESKDLNRIFKASKAKYGEKEGAKYNEAANRLVNPNQNTIIEVRSNGVVVKRGEKYFLLPFTNTDANYKKWELGSRPLDVTGQYAAQPNTVNQEIGTVTMSDAFANLTALAEELGNAVDKAVNPESAKSKAKSIADKLREGKVDTRNMMLSSIPFLPQVYNAAIEIIASTIEAGGTTIEAFQKGIDYIKNHPDFKKLNQAQQDEFAKDATIEIRKILEGEIDGEIRKSKTAKRLYDGMLELFGKTSIAKNLKLIYQSRNQEEVAKEARAMIEMLGLEKALDFVLSTPVNLDIRGAVLSENYAEAKKRFDRSQTPENRKNLNEALDLLKENGINLGQGFAYLKQIYRDHPELQIAEFESEINEQTQSNLGNKGTEKVNNVVSETKRIRKDIFNAIADVLNGNMDAVQLFAKGFLTDRKVKSALNVLVSFGKKLNEGDKSVLSQLLSEVANSGKLAIAASREQVKADVVANLKDINGRLKNTLTDKQLNDVADAFMDAYEFIAEKQISDAIDRAFKDTPQSGQQPKNGRVARLILYGALDSQQTLNAFAQKFGIPSITPEQKEQLQILANRVNQSKTAGAKAAAQQQLQDYIEMLKQGNSFYTRVAQRFIGISNTLGSMYHNNILFNIVTPLMALFQNVTRLYLGAAYRFAMGDVDAVKFAFQQRAKQKIVLDGKERELSRSITKDAVFASSAGIQRLSEYMLQGISRQESKIRQADSRAERILRRMFLVPSSRLFAMIDASSVPLYKAMNQYSVQRSLVVKMYQDNNAIPPKGTKEYRQWKLDVDKQVRGLIGLDVTNLDKLANEAMDIVKSSTLMTDLINQGAWDINNPFPEASSRKRPNSAAAQLYNEFVTIMYELIENGATSRFLELQNRKDEMGNDLFDTGKAKIYAQIRNDIDKFLAQNTNELAFFGRPPGTFGVAADVLTSISNTVPFLKYSGYLPLFINAMCNAGSYATKTYAGLNFIQYGLYRATGKRGFGQQTTFSRGKSDDKMILRIDQRDMLATSVVTTSAMIGLAAYLMSQYEDDEEKQQALKEGSFTGVVTELTFAQRQAFKDADGNPLMTGFFYKKGKPIFPYNRTVLFGIFEAAGFIANRGLLEKDPRSTQLFKEDDVDPSFSMSLGAYLANGMLLSLKTANLKDIANTMSSLMNANPDEFGSGLSQKAGNIAEKNFSRTVSNLIPYNNLQKQIANIFYTTEGGFNKKLANNFYEKIMMNTAFSHFVLKSNMTDLFGRPIPETLNIRGLLLGFNTFELDAEGNVRTIMDEFYSEDKYMSTHINKSYCYNSKFSNKLPITVTTDGSTLKEAQDEVAKLREQGIEASVPKVGTYTTDEVDVIEVIFEIPDESLNLINEQMGKSIKEMFDISGNIEALNNDEITKEGYKRFMDAAYNYARVRATYEMHKEELGDSYKNVVNKALKRVQGNDLVKDGRISLPEKWQNFD